MLVVQTVNALTNYCRVLALLTVMGDKQKAKSTIKEQSALVQKVDNNLLETVNTKKESKEVYQDHQKDFNWPFGKAPHFEDISQTG